MVKWPEHNEYVRDDELYLFAYCRTKWCEDPFASRLPEEYEEVAKALNAQFSDRFGEYSKDAVRRYLQRLDTDPKYRWPANSHKRFHQFAPETDAYIARYRAWFGEHPRSVQRTPIGAKRKSFFES